jgi:cytochrome c oxidase cbb3-type subunit I
MSQAGRLQVARLLAQHTFTWLFFANLVGVLLAALLLWPDLNGVLGPLTYGRWVPLHLNWQLYGWCALPLVGVLLNWCLDVRHPQVLLHAQLVLGAWSLALALGGWSWLTGVTSGKMFLEWHSWARALLPIAMVLLWGVLAAHVWWRRDELKCGALAGRVAFLVALVVVPSILYLSAGREFYPSVNPDSGGATGSRLLASTLGIVGIYGFIAEVLGTARRRMRCWYWGYFIFSGLVCSRIEHGNASHHDLIQIAGLATLLGWLPLAWLYFRGHTGLLLARRWWAAAFCWWVALVGSGLWTFLPGVSERLKFTNAMVAHAHLAMAGLVTSANMAVLAELRAAGLVRGFWLWQGACIAQVALLLALGWIETENEAAVFLSAPGSQLIYAGRLLAGILMLTASLQWWRSSLLRQELGVDP